MYRTITASMAPLEKATANWYSRARPTFSTSSTVRGTSRWMCLKIINVLYRYNKQEGAFRPLFYGPTPTLGHYVNPNHTSINRHNLRALTSHTFGMEGLEKDQHHKNIGLPYTRTSHINLKAYDQDDTKQIFSRHPCPRVAHGL
ncbi:hypothetical protein [Flagellimonas sp.]|uniref:hypothetical protein n=1 Tax=Flagellimonas sp. TaxID=2058762 RepID=UPI003F4A33BE